jgi:hypothetical protein
LFERAEAEPRRAGLRNNKSSIFEQQLPGLRKGGFRSSWPDFF